MHDAAYVQMDQLLTQISLPPGSTVCDVGSLDVNGTYRPLIEGRGWRYFGVDIRRGQNVDRVIEPYQLMWMDEAPFDLIISGSTLEHVREPWLWMQDVSDALKPWGTLIIITHHTFPFHEHPVDCFRFFPDGLKALFDQTGKLSNYDVQMYNDQDIYGVARRWA